MVTKPKAIYRAVKKVMPSKAQRIQQKRWDKAKAKARRTDDDQRR